MFLTAPLSAFSRCLFLALVAVSVGCLSGCGTKLVKATGTVLKDGQPISLSSTGVLHITLVPVVEGNADYTTHPGRADATGKFEIENVPPGKYKIAVEQMDPNPMTDQFKGAFNSANTKIIREVDGKTPLAIDLSEATATP